MGALVSSIGCILVEGDVLRLIDNEDSQGFVGHVGLVEKVVTAFFGKENLPIIKPSTIKVIQTHRAKRGNAAKDKDGQASQSASGIISAQQMYQELRKDVVGQDSQISQLCSEGYIHCLRRNALVESEKSGKRNEDIVSMGNRLILIAGPSGSGKSFTISNYCRLSGLPYVDFPATQITAQGYIGASVESPINILMEKCNYDMAKARYGVLFLDEADKLGLQSTSSSRTKDINGAAVQQELLTLVGGGNIELDTAWRRRSDNGGKLFSTVGLMTVLAGAFTELEDRLKYLQKKNDGLGFGGSRIDKQNHVLYDGLLQYYIPELLNRVSCFLMLSPLTVSSLVQICQRSVQTYNSLLTSQGLPEVALEPKAMHEIAEFCTEGKNPLLARGVKGIVGKLLHQIIMFPPAQKGGKIVFSASDVTKAIDGFMHMQEPSDIGTDHKIIEAEPAEPEREPMPISA